MPFGLGFGELILVFGILLMLFGAKRLPELADGMGKGIRDFKRALNGMDDPRVEKMQPHRPAAGVGGAVETDTKQAEV